METENFEPDFFTSQIGTPPVEKTQEEEFHIPRGISEAKWRHVSDVALRNFEGKHIDKNDFMDVILDGENREVPNGERVSYQDANKLYLPLGVHLGLVVDNIKVKKEVLQRTSETELQGIETWDQYEAFIGNLLVEIPGSTESFVSRVVRSFAKSAEIVLPEKPKTVGRSRGALRQAYINTFQTNPNASESDLYEALRAHTKNDETAQSYVKQWYEIMSTLAKIDPNPKKNGKKNTKAA